MPEELTFEKMQEFRGQTAGAGRVGDAGPKAPTELNFEDMQRFRRERTDKFINEAAGASAADAGSVVEDAGAGLDAAIAGTANTLSNTFMIMDAMAERFESITGLVGFNKGGGFAAAEDYFRTKARERAVLAREGAIGRDSIPSKIIRVLAGLPVQLTTAAAALALTKNPAVAFGSLGMIAAADQGAEAVVKGGVAGALVGAAFPATATLGPAARAGVVGTTAGLAEGVIVGGDSEDAALSGLVAGGLAALGAKRGPKAPKASAQAAKDAPAKPLAQVHAEAKGQPVSPQQATRDSFNQRRRAPNAPFEDARAAMEARRVEGAANLRTRQGLPVEDAPAPGGRTIARPVVAPPPVEITDATKAAARAAVARPGEVQVELSGGKVANLNLNRIKGPEDFKATLAQVTDALKPSIDKARRGKITQAETKQAANDLGMTVETFLSRRKGAALNAEELTAGRTLHLGAVKHMSELAARVRSGKASDIDKAEFLRSVKLVEGTTESLLGATAEAGRALQAMRIELAPRNLKAIRDAMAQFKGANRGNGVEEFADLMAQMENPAQLTAAVQSLKAKPIDMALEVWVNGLLSGPQTHVTNAVSNGAVALYAIPESFVQGTSGMLRAGSARMRGRPAPERVFLSEAPARMYGLVEGSREGMRLAAQAFRTGRASDFFNKTELPPRAAIPGRVGEAVRLPGRFLVSADEFFKGIGYRQEVNAQAVRTASREGLRGAAWRQRVAEIRANPPEAIRAAARQQARVQTFTNELGNIGKKFTSLRESHPTFTLIAPFIRTPTNIFKFAAQRTPLGLMFKDVRANIRKGGAARDIEMGKMAFGTMVGMAAMAEAAEGNLTGSGPAEPRARALWLASGRRPYSFRVGDEYISYRRIDPIGTVIGAAADFAQVAGHATREESDQIAGALVLAMRNNIEGKTFMQGVSQFFEAISDPERFMESYLANLAGSIVPAAVAQANRVNDPVLRQADSIIDKIRSRVPGLSEDLPARLNVWGEPIVLDGGLGPDFVSPFYSNTYVPDPVTEEAMRVGAKFGKTRKSMTMRGAKIELTDREHLALQEAIGKTHKVLLDRVVGTPGYRALTKDQKRELMERTRRRITARVRDDFLVGIMNEDPGRAAGIAQEVINHLRGSGSER